MKRMRVAGLCISIFALVSLLLSGAWVYAEDKLFSPNSLPKANASAGEQGCVEPVEIMRRNHMNFILHQRDDTMHRGIRTNNHSLVECVNCHVSKDESGTYPDINSKQHFCSGCHQYAAVSVDCFQCHASKPEQAQAKGGAGQ